MQAQKTEASKSEIILTIEITQVEYQPYLEKAAVQLSKTTKIEGFRPGKASYDIVKQRVGEMNIYQEALDDIISHFYWQAVMQAELDTIGQPKIELEKLAPGNPIIFKATVALMPKVTLKDWQTIKVKKAEVKVEESEVTKVIEDFKKMQAKESLIDKPAENGDRVEVDFEVSLDKVIIDGGQGKKYPIVIGENFMMPGFEEQLIGMKNGEEKKFQLKFPDSYNNKMVARKICDFKVKVLAVFKRELPELTDEWAKSLGSNSLSDLQNKLRENLEEEKKFKEEQRAEIEMLKKITEQTDFSEIPEILVANETHRMLHEFEDSITRQGLQFAEYLKNIKKEEKDIEEDFKPKAIERVKTSLAIKEIAETENIITTEEEIKQETEKILDQVKDNQEAQNNIKSEGYQHYLQTIVRNRKVVEKLKSQCIT